MWTWEKERRHLAAEPVIQPGMVTLANAETAVNLGGERRWLDVCAAGGMSWRPRQGQRVLVLKAGEDACVIGVMDDNEDLKPGESCLSGTACAIRLGEEIAMSGDVRINGVALEDLIRSIIAEELSGG